MSRLAGLSLIVGSVTGMVSACLVLFPSASRSCIKAFPRHKLSGGVLAALALTWSTVLLMNMHLGFLEPYKGWLLAIGPITFLLIIFFVDELLAPRALGGLLLLVPAPIIIAARLEESSWRYYALVVSYLMVIKGIALILHPYLFRKSCELTVRSDAGVRGWGLVGLISASVWIALAFTVF